MAGVKAGYTLGEATGVSCTATATDRAGNVQRTTGTYQVHYAWSGFLQPINDTGHGADGGVSVFKAGSTVPAKFQLRNAAGRPVPDADAQWLVPVKGSATTTTTDRSLFGDPAVSGAALRLDDGRQYYATIGLR